MKKSNMKASQGAGRLFWVVIVGVITLCVALVVHNQQSKPAHRSTKHVAVTAPVKQPQEVLPQVEAKVSDPVKTSINDIAPETEAALAQFGLSATSLVKIAVVVQPRSPVILPNPLANGKMQ